MRHASIRTLGAAALAALAAGALASCGNDVPTGAVAKVGDTVISQADFDKWLKTAAAGQAQGGQAAVPKPPDFTQCISAKEKTPAPQGQKKPSQSELKKQCEDEYDTLKREVMQFLIQAEWVQQEAEKQSIEVSDAEVNREFESQKKQSFPTEKAYKNFLETSGMSEKDILFRVRLNQLQQKLTQKITKDATKVSDEDVEEYYEKNEKQFAQPERRDLRVVLTKSEAKANEAKQAIEDGEPFKQVVKEYSIDDASKAQDGKLPSVAKGQQEKPLDEAVFAAKKDELEGPVETQFGWYVFEVTKITPASQQSLEEASETIKNILRSRRQQTALDDFVKDFRENYKSETNCADDYQVAECDNAPGGASTGPASGGTPQGQGGAQTVPQTQQQSPQPQTPSAPAPQE